jgi:hypothetical protein
MVLENQIYTLNRYLVSLDMERVECMFTLDYNGYEWNKELIKNPDRIYIGQELKIYAD